MQRWILHQTGMPTNTGTRIWNHLQLSLLSPHHRTLTNHTCKEGGPLKVLCGDLHHRPTSTIDTINLVGASLTEVYFTLPLMRVLNRSVAHHALFLQLLTLPEHGLFHQYLTQTARAMENHLPDNKYMGSSVHNTNTQSKRQYRIHP